MSYYHQVIFAIALALMSVSVVASPLLLIALVHERRRRRFPREEQIRWPDGSMAYYHSAIGKWTGFHPNGSMVVSRDVKGSKFDSFSEVREAINKHNEKL